MNDPPPESKAQNQTDAKDLSTKAVNGKDDASYLENPKSLDPSFSKLHWALGYPGSRRYNLHLLEDRVLIYASGNSVYIRSFDLGIIKTLTGHGNGIGALAVHPSRGYFAVGEKGKDPEIRIYSYPKVEVERVLKKGTKTRYASLGFSSSGKLLASVGSVPDFMLTVWDWEAEKVVLRNKAFSQNIFCVEFSPFNDGRLTTSGISHIRFWQMAETFTGLKLKGVIGKFGQIDLSDVSAFAEFPDGKILSGSESGQLLMWDGELLIFVVKRKDNSPCHNGAVETVVLNGHILTTGGMDGYIKQWNVSELEYAEVDEEDPIFRLEPINEIQIAPGSKVQGMVNGSGTWIVQDASGGILETTLSPPSFRPLWKFPEGFITGIVPSADCHRIITAGIDGVVRLWNVSLKRLVFERRFGDACNVLVEVPSKFDPKNRIVIGGFEDGVVRVLERCNDGFALRSALKVHDVGISTIAISWDGRCLASVAKDKTLFFLAFKENMIPSPIGFICLEQLAQSMHWASDSRKLLLSSGQNVIEIAKPNSAIKDSAKTWEISADPRIWKLQLPKKKVKKKTDNESGGKEQEEQQEHEEHETLSVLQVKYSSGGDFYGVYGGRLSNKLFECSFVVKYPLKEVNLTSEKNSLVTFMDFSKSYLYLLMGFKNGLVQIRTTDDLEVAMSYRAHDVDCQGITKIITTFDDAFVISAARDGTCFATQVDMTNAIKAMILGKKDKIEPSLHFDPLPGSQYRKLNEVEECEDITDHEAYSIERTKQQQEMDSQIRWAERKKEDVRKEIEAIRDMHQKLLEMNLELSEAQRLKSEEMDIDVNFRVNMEKKRKEAIRQAQREIMWDAEKTEIGLRKMEKLFFKDVMVENITIKGFNNNQQVSTLRTIGLPEWMKKEIEKVHQVIGQDVTASVFTTGKRESAVTRVSKKMKLDGLASLPKKKAHGQAERKALREELKRQRNELLREKPEDDADDPKDVAAMRDAKLNLKDYKLKSDPNYVVPESQRVNAAQKRRQMVLLQESVNFIKTGLNERVLALRNLKSKFIKSIEDDTKRILEINKILHKKDAEVFKVQKNPEEWPENRYIHTAEDLVAFEKQLQAEQKALLAAQKSSAYGGGGDDAESDETQSGERQEQIEVKGDDLDDEDSADRVQNTELQIREEEFYRMNLGYELKVLTDKINSTINRFDQSVAELRTEKFKLNADLQSTCLKLIVLYKELQILKEFEQREAELTKKLLKCRTAKAQVVVDLTECQDKLSVRLEEIQQWQQKDKAIIQEFESIVGGEKNPFYEPLKKLFKRKIKRAKKKLNDDDDSNSDESFDSGDDSSDSESSDEDETCPKDCDNVIFEKVIELREKRIAQEEILSGFQKSVEEIKAYNSSLQTKEKAIDKNLENTEEEIQKFQTEKQQSLNEIDVFVPLTLSQIQCLVPKGNSKGNPMNQADQETPVDKLDPTQFQLPADIDKMLVFSSKALQKLKERITELYEEKAALCVELAELKNMDKSLNRRIKQKMSLIEVEKERCEDVQMLKFGQLVSLEVLDSATENEEANLLKRKLEELTKEHFKTRLKWDRKVRKAENDYSLVNRENTKMLHKVAALTSKKHMLDDELDWMQEHGQTIDPNGPDEIRRNEEMTQLVELAKAQNTEIDALKAEIHMLQRKGGHLYDVQVEGELPS